MSGAEIASRRRQAAAVAAVAVAALLLLAAASFSQAPLPESKASVSYYPDLVWGMSFAAEALHHWPVTTPQVAGEPLRYHTFAFLEMAATAQARASIFPPWCCGSCPRRFSCCSPFSSPGRGGV